MNHIESFFIGPMDNISYVLSETETYTAMIVDPAWDVGPMITYLEDKGLRLNGVLLTHGHHDHVNALDTVLDYRHVTVYLSESEVDELIPETNVLVRVEHQKEIILGTSIITAYATPGHTPGGMCYLVNGHLITGDTLFVDGCGRCDLPHSNVKDMYTSLEWIKTLPDDTIIYPGHHYGDHPTDLLGQQKITNRFLTCTNSTDFIRKRMGTG